jgi:UDP-galactopyranose mutase
VVYDHDRAKNVKVIREWLRKQDIILAGRYSEWEYYNSDHAFLAGKKAAQSVRQMRAECERSPGVHRNLPLGAGGHAPIQDQNSTS